MEVLILAVWAGSHRLRREWGHQATMVDTIIQTHMGLLPLISTTRTQTYVDHRVLSQSMISSLGWLGVKSGLGRCKQSGFSPCAVLPTEWVKIGGFPLWSIERYPAQFLTCWKCFLRQLSCTTYCLACGRSLESGMWLLWHVGKKEVSVRLSLHNR